MKKWCFLLILMFVLPACASKLVNDVEQLNAQNIRQPVPIFIGGVSLDGSKDARSLHSDMVMLIKSRIPDGFILVDNQAESHMQLRILTLYFGDNWKKATKKISIDSNDQPHLKSYYGTARIFVSGPDGVFRSDTFSSAPVVTGKQTAIESNASNMADSVVSLLSRALGRTSTLHGSL